MKLEIKCPTCQKVLGSLEKEVFSDADKDEYIAMLQCTCSAPIELIAVE